MPPLDADGATDGGHTDISCPPALAGRLPGNSAACSSAACSSAAHESPGACGLVGATVESGGTRIKLFPQQPAGKVAPAQPRPSIQTHVTPPDPRAAAAAAARVEAEARAREDAEAREREEAAARERAEAEARERAEVVAEMQAANEEAEMARKKNEEAEAARVEQAALKRELLEQESALERVEADLKKNQRMASSSNQVLRARLQPKITQLSADRTRLYERIRELKEGLEVPGQD